MKRISWSVPLIASLTAATAGAQQKPPVPPAAPAPAPAAAPPPPAAAPPPAYPTGAEAGPQAAPPPVMLEPAQPGYSEPPPPPAPAGEAGPSGPGSRKGDVLVGMAWDIALPVGSVHDFIADTSVAGFEISLRYFVIPKLSIGVSTDWQSFSEDRPRTTFQIENGALTATAYNSIWGGTLRGLVHFYPLEKGPVLPFIGGNIGVGWSTLQTSAADLVLYDNQTSVALGGDLGALIQPNRHSPTFLVAARYSAQPAAEFLDVTDVQTVTFQFGLMMR